jgi:hypothetical protein
MSEIAKLRLKRCVCCSIRLDTSKRRDVRRVNKSKLLNKLNTVKPIIQRKKGKEIDTNIISITDIVCGACRCFANKYKSNVNNNLNQLYPTLPVMPSMASSYHTSSPYASSSQASLFAATTSTASTSHVDIDDDQIDQVILYKKIPRTIKSSKNCFICHKSKNLINVPKTAYLDTFINNNILIPNESKCCKAHLNRNKTFQKQFLNDIETVSNYSTLNGSDVKLLLDSLRHAAKHTLLEKFSNKKNITDNQCKQFTNLNKNQFYSLVTDLKSLKESPSRTKPQALATYLFWLKTGLDYRTIATLLSIDNFQAVGQYCDQVRKAMLSDFVPNNLGVTHMTRNDWLNYVRLLMTLLPEYFFYFGNIMSIDRQIKS